MPAKILLADKSITIQKVVEMLFSGKEYEVTCVSDGESALSEAARIVPDVALVDVDLPRIDGYAFVSRLKDTPALARTPAILMLSRDDVYDAGKGKLSGIADHIAKPFESQDLIGKVKKALSAAPSAPAASPGSSAAKAAMASPSRPAPPASAPTPPAPRSAPAPAPTPPPRQEKQAAPSDIFDIIEEAPAPAMAQAATPLPKPGAAGAADEELFEVEPEYEVLPETPVAPTSAPLPPSPAKEAVPRSHEPMAGAPEPFETEQIFGKAEASPGAAVPYDFGEPLQAEAETALPRGQKAVEEMREGLGLREGAGAPVARHPDIVSFESLDMASRASHEEYAYSPPAAAPAPAAPGPSASRAQETSSGAATRTLEGNEALLMSVAKDAVEKAAKEILERVAWEVIPDLAERLIREEIERLKAEQ